MRTNERGEKYIGKLMVALSVSKDSELTQLGQPVAIHVSEKEEDFLGLYGQKQLSVGDIVTLVSSRQTAIIQEILPDGFVVMASDASLALQSAGSESRISANDILLFDAGEEVFEKGELDWLHHPEKKS